MSRDAFQQAVYVGPFRLIEPLGVGGMGEVWRAVHRATGTSAAVKVINEAYAREETFRATFHREARAMAQLDHPAIIRVFDYGRVSPATEEASSGQFVDGSPYVAMEMAPDGTLYDLMERGYGWEDVHRILLSVLDALAHAHARDLLHRDIKPDNVLASRDGGSRQWKLTDFGLAHSMSTLDADRPEGLVGTPAFMAPEQFVGDWRDFGPETDLYAVGCMAYQLVSGRLPFFADNPLDLGRMHLHDEPPPPDTRFETPDTFWPWLHCLLSKDPSDRFARAADAAFVLSDMEVVQETAPTAVLSTTRKVSLEGLEAIKDQRPISSSRAREEMEITDRERQGFSATKVHSIESLSREKSVPTRLDFELREPRVPRDWTVRARPPSHSLTAMSPRLYGLRDAPVVGREETRARLWSSLREVEERGRSQVCVLSGPAGCGKSRLARWLCETAAETGAANVLVAKNGPEAAAEHGLSGMLARWAKLEGLDGDDLEERISTVVGGEDDAYRWLVEDLARLDDPVDPDRTLRTNRLQAVWEVMRRRAARRPLVVWIDDLQWADDAFGLLEYIHAHALDEAPILFCATVQPDVLLERKLTSARFDAIVERPWAELIELEPLEPDEIRALLDELLVLDDALANEVVERVEGNPLFAVQIIGDWIDREWLTIGERGFRLKAGVEPELPTDLHSIWMERVDRLLDDGTQDDARALELGAILGRKVDGDVWSKACQIADLQTSESLLGSLVLLKLAQRNETGWRFSHGMLRDSLLRRARETEDWAELNLAVAYALEAYHSGDKSPYAARIGECLVEAGAYEEAIPHLLSDARDLVSADEKSATLHLVDLLDVAYETVGESARPSWLQGQLVRARALSQLHQLDDAAEIADTVRDVALEEDLRRVAAEALELRCRIEHLAGRVQGAAFYARKALEIFEELDDGEGVVAARLRLGDHGAYAGQLGQAASHYRKALEIAHAHDMAAQRAWAHWGIGYVFHQRLAFEPAAEHLRIARRLFEEVGNQRREMSVLSALSDIDRLTGAFERAEERLERICDVFRAQGTNSAMIAVNLAMVHLLTGRRASAIDWLREAEANVPQEALGLSVIQATWLAIWAGVDDAEPWDARYSSLVRTLEDTGFVDIDIAFMLEQAAKIAASTGHRPRAAQMWELAVDIWDKLDLTTRAESARKQLRRLVDDN